MKRAALPKIRINGYKNVVNLFTLETFTDFTADSAAITMSVKEAGGAIVYVIQGGLQVYGYTFNSTDAFAIINNCGGFTCAELYEALRGRKV